MNLSTLVSYLVVVMVIPLASLDIMTNVQQQQQQQQQHHSISRLYNNIRNQALRKPSSSIESGCPAEFTQYGDYCFHGNDAWFTAIEATSYCSGLSASLPFPIGDLAEWQTAVAGAITDGWNRWSGAMKGSDDGVWRWEDNTTVTEEAWGPGQPDEEYDACSIIDHSSGTLYDNICSNPWHVLCQVSFGISSTTELPKTTTDTEAPTTSTELLKCYSCYKCNSVDFNTTVELRGVDKSCFTALYGDNNIVIRGIAPDHHIDGECDFIDGNIECYCNDDLCNNEAATFKELSQTV